MYICVTVSFYGNAYIINRCGPIFILELTGSPEPSDQQCQEAHTFCEDEFYIDVIGKIKKRKMKKQNRYE